MKIEFSVLSYYPSMVTNENINIGVIFSVPSMGFVKLGIINNWRRVSAFDDECDIHFMKDYLKGMSTEVESNIFGVTNEFSIEQFARHYVNSLRFGEIVKTETKHDLDEFIDSVKKVYLHYDYDKSKRMKKQSQIKFIKSIMKDNDIGYSEGNVTGNFSESINFDYRIGDYVFKFFDFENKNVSRQLSSVKSWAYSAAELSKKYKIVFVINNEYSDEHQVLVDILNHHAHDVIDNTKVLDYIMTYDVTTVNRII